MIDFILKIVNNPLENINHITVIFFFLGATILAIYTRIKKQSIELARLLMGSLGTSTIPTGIVLMGCAFDISLIQKLKGVEIGIAAAGVALVFVAIKTFIEEIKRIEDIEDIEDKEDKL